METHQYDSSCSTCGISWERLSLFTCLHVSYHACGIFADALCFLSWAGRRTSGTLANGQVKAGLDPSFYHESSDVFENNGK